MTWEEFTKMFIKKWLPPGGRATLSVSFETLKHDAISILEHNIKFKKLSYYDPHLTPTNDDKIDHFDLGLILDIRKYATSGRRNILYANFMDLVMDLEKIPFNREQNKKARTFGTFSAIVSSGKG